MTMQTQKTKPKKSYSELLNEIRSVMSKTAAVYVPELCTALAVENPNLPNKEIRDQIHLDLKGIWAETTIESSLPSWIFNQKHVSAAKKRWEEKTKQAREILSKNLKNVSNAELPEIKLPQPYQRHEPEEVDQELHELGLADFGGSKKSIRELKGDITEAAANLFKALTNQDGMPDEGDDLLVDYIKPTREFRKSLILELDERDKTTIHNWLHYTSEAIEDMIRIIKES